MLHFYSINLCCNLLLCNLLLHHNNVPSLTSLHYCRIAAETNHTAFATMMLYTASPPAELCLNFSYPNTTASRTCTAALCVRTPPLLVKNTAWRRAKQSSAKTMDQARFSGRAFFMVEKKPFIGVFLIR